MRSSRLAAIVARSRLLVGCGLLTAIAACKGDKSPSAPGGVGSVRVTVATDGTPVDPDGYAVSVDNGTAQAVPVNGSLVVDNVAAGDRSVALSGVAANCAADANAKSVNVAAGAEAPVSFHVTCGPPEGAGARILFTSMRDGNFELYSTDAAGTDVRRLTTTPEQTEDAPAWSPDYSKIAFARGTALGTFDIYVMNADGSGLTQLTTTAGDDNFPAWSPDGSKIAFTSNRDGDDEIYVMNADGSQPTNLTNSPSKDQVPAWSPDGSRLAFQSDREGGPGLFEIFTIQPDGSQITKIVSSPGGDFHPTYSPDGSRLLFASSRDDPQREIYVVNVDGTGLLRLTDNPAVDNWPTWSPDGTRIAFFSSRDGNAELYVMDANGANQARLTNNTADDTRPAWRP